MRLVVALACLAMGFSMAGAAQADAYQRLKTCLSAADEPCLETVGLQLAQSLENPRDKALMLARFALADWASGKRLAGDTRLLQAWTMLASVPNEGCAPRAKATLDFADLAARFGDAPAAKLVLHSLVESARAWPKDTASKCERPDGEAHWLAQVAERQGALGDDDGLNATLDLAYAWAMSADMPAVSYSIAPDEAAALLSANGRQDAAKRVCDEARSRIVGALDKAAPAASIADADWQALACYRKAGLKASAQALYGDYATSIIESLGLADAAHPGPVSDEDAFGPALFDLVGELSWNDPVLVTDSPDLPFKDSRACFLAPSARCLSVHTMDFVDNARRSGARNTAYGTIPDFRKPGALDGFGRFLVDAGGDVVGDQARSWFLDEVQHTPIGDLRSVVRDAIDAGDLVWARRIFYAWYNEDGEDYFNHLLAPSSDDKKAMEEDLWPAHVAWSIATLIDELEPAFEPEELASFAATAWDQGIVQLPALRDIPLTELIDTDERSGEHLLDLCFRDAFSEWAADLFTHAHVTDRAAAARDTLLGAARDCAFAKRSIGPLLNAASWYASKGDLADAQSLLAEGADRLTRAHYHLYHDADPALGGAALAVMAIGLKRGLIVPPPYSSVF